MIIQKMTPKNLKLGGKCAQTETPKFSCCFFLDVKAEKGLLG